ncbi:ATP-binding protein [Streptomyces smyrnaeus]|uniref:ATP-binding protein n=1 Tax=Streptomyces smyrnaeus TaxID=1387713 RepID=A0ABS3XPG6_9ACTN|nr:ATP-binding protein [Streptomyces smyrnaeus]MBO8197199.1 ATP-binding protein [Streptomyces smyrnaeus]
MEQVADLRDGESVATGTVRTRYLRSSFQARRLTRNFLATLSPPPSSEAAETVLLVVSELVTNALRHGDGVRDFRLSIGHETVTVEVADSSSVLPRDRSPQDFTEGEDGGFGWPIVCHLARDVTIRAHPETGKTVCADIPL